MTFALLQDGTQIAAEPLSSSDSGAPLRISIQTTGDVLASLAAKPMTGANLAMLKSTCALFGKYLDLPGDAIPLEAVESQRRGFRKFLVGRRYTAKSVATYIFQARQLLIAGKKFGWDPDASLSQLWKSLRDSAQDKNLKAMVVHIARRRRSPAEITLDDLEQWGLVAQRDGLAYNTTLMKKRQFCKLLRDFGYKLELPSQKRSKPYGIPLEQLPPILRDEVLALLKWKQAEFAPNRPKRGKIRPVSAKCLRDFIGQIAGYALNVRRIKLTTFAELIQKSVLEGFVDYAINERGKKGTSLTPWIGMIYAIVKNHTSFADRDYRWMKALQDSIPLEDASERRRRKAEKFLEYEVVESIPAKIRAELDTALRRKQVRRAAGLGMEELMMRWLLVLPWRQRNIRECRVGGKNPNIFKARISPFSDIDLPAWVVAERVTNPEAEFWQVHFAPAETKTGVEIRAVLPRQLVAPLEEYLSKFRPELLNGRSTETLFLNQDGGMLHSSRVGDIVGEWTFRYGGVRMNPHQARDSFAFRWLKEHPRDFLLLAKMLWHRNVQTTIQIYGARFNVSSGMCAVEEWLDRRGGSAQ